MYNTIGQQPIDIESNQMLDILEYLYGTIIKDLTTEDKVAGYINKHRTI